MARATSCCSIPAPKPCRKSKNGDADHGRLQISRRLRMRCSASRARSRSPARWWQWLRDNLRMIKAAPEVEELAASVEDNGGLLHCSRRSRSCSPRTGSQTRRGVFAGLTRYVTAGHIARATLEATAFQSRELVDAMNLDSGVELESLKVDGGMVGNDLLMQFQADILGVPVMQPAGAGNDVAGRRVRGRPQRPGSGTRSRTCARTGSRTSAGSPRWTPRSATSTTRSGRRP